MTTPYVGEIRLFGFQRIPVGWFACDGSLKPISEYQVLYTLLGTTYGGDGVQTFAVPDLRGQVPIHWGTGLGLRTRVIGESGGSEQVTLLNSQLPQHNHLFVATTNGATAPAPGPTVTFGALPSDHLYENGLTTISSTFNLAANVIGQSGGSLPHDNTMPTLTLSICISSVGIFPSRN